MPGADEYCESCGDQLDFGVCGNSPRCERAPCAELREAIYLAQDGAAGVRMPTYVPELQEHLRIVSCALLAELGLPDSNGRRHRSGT